MKSIIEQFNKINKIKVFEFEVIDKRTNEIECLIFDIEINEKLNQFEVSHPALNKQQEESKYVSYFTMEIDNEQSLDNRLAGLYSESMEKIINSEYYTFYDGTEE